MIKLTEFDKISDEGVYVPGIGQIHSPYLKDIKSKGFGYTRYQYLLSLMITTPEEYFSQITSLLGIGENPFSKLSAEEAANMTMFDILTACEDGRDTLRAALSLFIFGEIEWSNEHQKFLVNKKVVDDKLSVEGVIDSSNFKDIVRACMELANIETEEEVENLKFKNEAARRTWLKMKAAKKRLQKAKKRDPDYELANIISAICTFHNSLNYTNIFELTVYQVHDTFARLMREQQLDIVNTSHAVWGGEYDSKLWFKQMKSDNL